MEEVGDATGEGGKTCELRDGTIAVVADHREIASGVIEELQRMSGVEVRLEQLPVGDYLVDGVCLFERKSLRDLARSIIDGRLFSQAKRLVAGPLRAAVILEGTSRDLEGSAMSRESVLGAIVSLTLVFELPVLRSRNPAESARLHNLCRAATALAGERRAASSREAAQGQTPSSVAPAAGFAWHWPRPGHRLAGTVRERPGRHDRCSRSFGGRGRDRGENRLSDPRSIGVTFLCLGLFQDPHRDLGSNNAGLASTTPRPPPNAMPGKAPKQGTRVVFTSQVSFSSASSLEQSHPSHRKRAAQALGACSADQAGPKRSVSPPSGPGKKFSFSIP